MVKGMTVNMNNNLFEEISLDISNLFDIEIEEVKKNNNKKLTEEPFNLLAEDLLRLYYYLEKKYKIQFNKAHVENYNFLFLGGIVESVNGLIKQKV